MTRPIGRAAALALAAFLTTIAAAVAATPAQDKGSPLLHVVFVGADSQAASATPARPLPASVAAALAELRDQLPFERFQILDTAVARARGGAHLVLRGPRGERFVVGVNGREGELGGRPVYVVDRFVVRRADRAKDQAVEAGDEPLSASFVMDPGETLVVGSSRLASDDAFVVLVTALD